MDKMFSVFTNIVVVSFVHEVYMHATRYIEEINYTHTHTHTHTKECIMNQVEGIWKITDCA